MTYQEFLQKLSETPRNWKFGSEDRIRCGNAATLTSLRCPLTQASGNNRLTVANYMDAAGLMGLDAVTAMNIAQAADGFMFSSEGLTGARQPLTPECEAIRADLLRACDLAPAEEPPVSTWQPNEAAFLASLRDLIQPPIPVEQEE